MIGRTVTVVVMYVAVGLLVAVTLPRESDIATVDVPEAVLRPGERPAVSWASGRVSRDVFRAATPIRLDIPAIRVSADIVATGIDAESQQMEVPPADEVGWYRFGPRPGEPGSAVLAGHVDVPGSIQGVFYDLDRLEAGHEVTIHLSDGTSQVFEVIETIRVPKADLDLQRVFASTGPARVTLITCGGAFNETEHSYSDNIVSELRPLGVGA